MSLRLGNDSLFTAGAVGEAGVDDDGGVNASKNGGAASIGARAVKELEDANKQLTVLRHLWRLAFELKCIAQKSYQYGAKLIVELGQQVGGWQKASR